MKTYFGARFRDPNLRQRHAAHLRRRGRKVVSARLDKDSPTLRITGRPKKLEHISVLFCVTRICVSATLRFHGVAPARERSALASATPRPNALASCDGGRVSQLHT